MQNKPTDFLTISKTPVSPGRLLVHIQLGEAYVGWHRDSKNRFERIIKNINDNLPVRGHCVGRFQASFSVDEECVSQELSSVETIREELQYFLEALQSFFARSWFIRTHLYENIYVTVDGEQKVYHRSGDSIVPGKLLWRNPFRSKKEYDLTDGIEKTPVAAS